MLGRGCEEYGADGEGKGWAGAVVIGRSGELSKVVVEGSGRIEKDEAAMKLTREEIREVIEYQKRVDAAWEALRVARLSGDGVEECGRRLFEVLEEPGCSHVVLVPE